MSGKNVTMKFSILKNPIFLRILLYCNTLYHNAQFCNILYHIILYNNISYHIVLY